MQMRCIAAGLIMVAAALTAHTEPAPDQVARSLGEMEWHASVCHLPTAPLEAALERYIQRIQAGALEAKHLRQEMLAGRAEFERLLGSNMNCNSAPSEVANAIAKVTSMGLTENTLPGTPPIEDTG
jgi:hypothetical protein